jgi:TRAP-type C4-dicarboxylate transport system permease small subunit
MHNEASRPAEAGPALRLYIRVVQSLCDLAMALSAIGLLASLVLIAWAVVMRYIFNQAPVWVDEVVGFLLVGIVMLAAASTYRRDEHIGVDLLVSRLTGRARRWMVGWAALTTALVAIVLIRNGWETASLARTLGLLTEGNLEWPQWLLMLMLPVGGVLLLLTTVETFWRSVADQLPGHSQDPHLPKQDEPQEGAS